MTYYSLRCTIEINKCYAEYNAILSNTVIILLLLFSEKNNIKVSNKIIKIKTITLLSYVFETHYKEFMLTQNNALSV